MLLLDYDGTLQPFAPTPEEANPDDALMALVAAVLFVAGAPLRVFAGAGALAALAVFVLVTGSANRMNP